MKRYLFPLILFLIAQGFGIILYKLSEPFLTKEYSSIGMRLVVGIAFFIFIIKYLKNKRELFEFGKIFKGQLWLTLLLFSLFAINNYFLSSYSTNVEFMKNSVIELVIVGFIVNSFYEEFAYRGFIQGYVNQSSRIVKTPLSKGNLFASSLMLISHFGFFAVMDTLFAITSLLLVGIFSLVLGYMRDKGASIWFLIIIHTTVNFIHLIINLNHYN